MDDVRRAHELGLVPVVVTDDDGADHVARERLVVALERDGDRQLVVERRLVHRHAEGVVVLSELDGGAVVVDARQEVQVDALEAVGALVARQEVHAVVQLQRVPDDAVLLAAGREDLGGHLRRRSGGRGDVGGRLGLLGHAVAAVATGAHDEQGAGDGDDAEHAGDAVHC